MCNDGNADSSSDCSGGHLTKQSSAPMSGKMRAKCTHKHTFTVNCNAGDRVFLLFFHSSLQ